jgi:hypothetical protein
MRVPFSCIYITNEDKLANVLLKTIIRPLEDLGLVSDTTSVGRNTWQGWMRVPKKGESWEGRKDRINGIRNVDGVFCRMNITYVSSSESALRR